MPRRERVYSPTGIYHVMLRGINRNNLFLDSQDFYKMSKILKAIAKPVEINGDIKVPVCSIYAYCLMTNHIHLLISENKETISETMKRIGVAYASYFNKRYKRSGPLFEGRFRSEPVWDVEYFCTLIHYIHNAWRRKPSGTNGAVTMNMSFLKKQKTPAFALEQSLSRK